MRIVRPATLSGDQRQDSLPHGQHESVVRGMGRSLSPVVAEWGIIGTYDSYVESILPHKLRLRVQSPEGPWEVSTRMAAVQHGVAVLLRERDTIRSINDVGSAGVLSNVGLEHYVTEEMVFKRQEAVVARDTALWGFASRDDYMASRQPHGQCGTCGVVNKSYHTEYALPTPVGLVPPVFTPAGDYSTARGPARHGYTSDGCAPAEPKDGYNVASGESAYPGEPDRQSLLPSPGAGFRFAAVCMHHLVLTRHPPPSCFSWWLPFSWSSLFSARDGG